MTKKISILLCCFMALAACSSKPDPEQLANAMIEQARTDLQNKQYDAARDSIKSLRTLYPTAIKARAAAILLLDSVEMEEAREELEPIGPELEAERAQLNELMKDPHYKKNDAYHEQNRKVFALEQVYDSIATKVKFFERKILEDKNKQNK